MFYCFECEKEFDQPEKLLDSVEEFWGSPAARYIPVCPHCKSDDYDEISFECDRCGKKIFKGLPNTTDDGEELCDDCYAEWEESLPCEEDEKEERVAV